MVITQEEVSVSAGAIIISFREGIPRILLLMQNNKRYGRISNSRIVWDIGPKGRIEKEERIYQTMSREIREEIGVNPILDKRFRAIARFSFEKKDSFTKQPYRIRRKVIYTMAYLPEEHENKIKLSDEHVGYRLLPIPEALRQKGLKTGQKQIIRQAASYLKKHKHQPTTTTSLP